MNPEKRGINIIDVGNVEVNKIKLPKRKLDAKGKVKKLKEKVEDVVDDAVDKLQGVDPKLMNGSNTDKNNEEGEFFNTGCKGRRVDQKRTNEGEK